MTLSILTLPLHQRPRSPDRDHLARDVFGKAVEGGPEHVHVITELGQRLPDGRLPGARSLLRAPR
jgi:hypothetical protein